MLIIDLVSRLSTPRAKSRALLKMPSGIVLSKYVDELCVDLMPADAEIAVQLASHYSLTKRKESIYQAAMETAFDQGDFPAMYRMADAAGDYDSRFYIGELVAFRNDFDLNRRMPYHFIVEHMKIPAVGCSNLSALEKATLILQQREMLARYEEVDQKAYDYEISKFGHVNINTERGFVLEKEGKINEALAVFEAGLDFEEAYRIAIALDLGEKARQFAVKTGLFYENCGQFDASANAYTRASLQEKAEVTWSVHAAICSGTKLNKGKPLKSLN